MGIAGHKRKFTAFAPAAAVPALFRKGAMEALGGRLASSRDALVLRKQGATMPLRVNRMRRYILTVADFGQDASRKVRGPAASARNSEWALISKRLVFPNGGLHLPHSEAGLHRFDPPRTFPACKAVTLGDVLDGWLSDPKKTAIKLHVKWGHAPAQQLRRLLAASDGDNFHSLTCVDEDW